MQSPRTILERLEATTLSPSSAAEPDLNRACDFVAVIRKQDPSQKLGMVHKSKNGRLIILEVKSGGLAMRYNEDMEKWHPGTTVASHQLQANDEIVNVNGEQRIAEMKTMLGEQDALFIHVRRTVQPLPDGRP